MAYLIANYKGVYRMRTPYDLGTSQYPREPDGKLAESDIYIECDDNIKIFYYGHGILEVYIPSTSKGKNILKSIYRDHINESNTQKSISTFELMLKGKLRNVTKEYIHILDDDLYWKELNSNNIIFHIEETDEELLFRFKAKDLDKLVQYLNPKTYGADRSPFSKKNLPKTQYDIPNEELQQYKDLIGKLDENNKLIVAHYTKDFIKSLATKKNTYENIKSDMATKRLKGKEYIHSIGKWDSYIKYLTKEIEAL